MLSWRADQNSLRMHAAGRAASFNTMDAHAPQNTAAQQGEEVQVSCSFFTKLGADFRVPEAPIVSM